MKRFRFRLETLERLRLAESRAAAAVLAEGMRDAAEAKRRLGQVDEELLQAERDWRVEPDGSDGRALRVHAEFLEMMRGRRADASTAEQRARAELATREQDYSVRARAHRVLEKLRERRRKRWFEQGSREEQKLLDELHRLRSSENGRTAKESGR